MGLHATVICWFIMLIYIKLNLNSTLIRILVDFAKIVNPYNILMGCTKHM
jgi:hypothetical protein